MSNSTAESIIVLKLFLNISDKGMGHYRSFKVDVSETFSNLKNRVLDKIAVSRTDSCYYSFMIKFYSDSLRSRCSFRVRDEEIICQVLEREDTHYSGEYAIVFSDIRCENGKRAVDEREKVLSSSSLDNLGNRTSHRIDTGAELIYDSQNYNPSITEVILNEIQSISLKTGRLYKRLSHGRDLWREVEVYLTHNRLWYQRVLDNDCILTYIELPSTARVVTDESQMLFSICVRGEESEVKHYFKCSSKNALFCWVECIRERNDLCSENSVIMMADEYTSNVAYMASALDNALLLEGTTFEGTLQNNYLRSEFQNYLSKNFTEESLKFWEYAEDYRRGHPLSLQPFLDLNAVKVMDKHAKNKKLGVSMGNSYGGGSGADIAAIQHAIMNPNITTEPSDTDVNKMASKVLTESERKMANEWARMIYNTYIDDGAPMQIGDCSSDMKEEIAAALTKGDVDAGLYFNIQIKIFHNMKYKQFLEFVLQPGYRKFLMSSLLHKNCVCPSTGQSWTHISPFAPYMLVPEVQAAVASETDSQPVSTSWRLLQSIGFGAAKSTSATKESKNLATDNVSSIGGFAVDGKGGPDGQKLQMYAPWRYKPDDNAAKSVLGTRVKNRIVLSLTTSKCTMQNWLPTYWWSYFDINRYKATIQSSTESPNDRLSSMLPFWMQALQNPHLVAKGRAEYSDFIRVKSGSDMSELVSDMRKETNRKENARRMSASRSLSGLVIKTPPGVNTQNIEFNPSSDCGSNFQHKGFQADNNNSSLSLPVMKIVHIERNRVYLNQLPQIDLLGSVTYVTWMYCKYTSVGLVANIDNSSSSIKAGEVKSAMIATEGPVSSGDLPVSPTAVINSDGVKSVCVFLQNEEGGQIALFDGVNGSHLYALININEISKLRPSAATLRTFEIHDVHGKVWSMRPEGMGEDETREACRQWLQLLSYQSPNTVYSVLICHEGYLSKRGRLNTAFKKRWFVLDSEQMLYYYKDDGGQAKLKGELDASAITDIKASGLDLTFTALDRQWILQAETPEEVGFWVIAFSSARQYKFLKS